MCKLNYESMCELLGVTKSGGKYFWHDTEHRCFEVQSRRRILVPFEMAGSAMQRLRFRPVLVDVEPDWETLKPHDPMLLPPVAVVL